METIANDLQDLSAFAVLLECGSFTRAAEKLGCSKGQLSKRIATLELTLGATLVHRTTRRLSLTAAGAALLPEAQALNAQPRGRGRRYWRCRKRHRARCG